MKLISFLNAPSPRNNARPVLTLKLPGDEKSYTFVLIDMRIMAGPLRTPGNILSEVKPFSPNFYIRRSREIAAQIASAGPTEQLSILAEYWRTDRVLSVQSFEESEELRQ